MEELCVTKYGRDNDTYQVLDGYSETTTDHTQGYHMYNYYDDDSDGTTSAYSRCYEDWPLVEGEPHHQDDKDSHSEQHTKKNADTRILHWTTEFQVFIRPLGT